MRPKTHRNARIRQAQVSASFIGKITNLDYRGLDLDSAFDLRLRTGGLDCGDVCHHRED